MRYSICPNFLFLVSKYLRLCSEAGMTSGSVWSFTWVDESTPALGFYQRNGGRIVRTWLSLERPV